MKPGFIGLTRIGGFLGWLIGLGQWLIGDGSRFTHAFIVCHNGSVIEAMPSGARIRHFDSLDLPFASSWQIRLTTAQIETIVRRAHELVGTGYGFFDYVAIALASRGVRPKWLMRYVRSSKRMICSQLVAECYLEAGIVLCPGKDTWEITPGDIANALIERDWSDLSCQQI